MQGFLTYMAEYEQIFTISEQINSLSKAIATKKKA